ncbi:MAG: hypothetical protein ACE361_21920 [Aureliella sp.]
MDDQSKVNELADSEPPILGTENAIAPVSAAFGSKGSIIRYGAVNPSTRADLIDDEMDSVWSILAVFGLALLTFLAAIGMSLAMEVIDEWNIRPRPFVRFSFIVQSIFYPPVVCFCFTTTTLLFWYGPITLRFIAACCAVLPAVVGFCAFMDFFDNGPTASLWGDVCVVMIAMLLSSTMVALMIQLWTRWTLTHSKSQHFAPPTGIQSIIELTVIGAIASLAFTIVDLGYYWIGIAFFAAFGAGGTIAVLCSQIAYLRHEQNATWPYFIGILPAFACCYGVNSFFAAMEFGGGVATAFTGWYYIGPLAVYGTLVVSALVGLQLYLLRKCGWRCIDRRILQGRRLSSSNTIASEQESVSPFDD